MHSIWSDFFFQAKYLVRLFKKFGRNTEISIFFSDEILNCSDGILKFSDEILSSSDEKLQFSDEIPNCSDEKLQFSDELLELKGINYH